MAEKLEAKGKDDEGSHDRFQAITSSSFAKRAPPVIRDDDPDLDRHDLEFDNLIACNTYGKTKPRDIDILHWYGNGFPPERKFTIT